jgi:hypothetical protein
MNSIQYTIRGIPEELDRHLREDARAADKSLNRLIIERLEQASLPTGPPYHSLDWFFGSEQEPDDQEDVALRWLDSLPRNLPE